MLCCRSTQAPHTQCFARPGYFSLPGSRGHGATHSLQCWLVCLLSSKRFCADLKCSMLLQALNMLSSNGIRKGPAFVRLLTNRAACFLSLSKPLQALQDCRIAVEVSLCFPQLPVMSIDIGTHAFSLYT